MPSAYEMEEIHAFKGAEGDKTVEIHAVDTATFTAHVFKTTSEPHIGEVSYFRTFSGTVSNGRRVYNATRDGIEKMGHLSVAQGKGAHRGADSPSRRHRLRGEAAQHAHERHAVDEGAPVRLPQIQFPEPIVTFAVRADVAPRRGEAAAGHSSAARRGSRRSRLVMCRRRTRR
jgi:elongation factor G